MCYCCYIIFFSICYKPHKTLILSLSMVYIIYILPIYSFLVLLILFSSLVIPSRIIFPLTESAFISKVNIYISEVKYILLFVFSFILFWYYFSVIFPLMKLSLFLSYYVSSFSLFFPLCFSILPFLLLKFPVLPYGLMMMFCFMQMKEERGINENYHKCKICVRV